MLTAIRTRLTSRRARSEAKDVYFTADREAGHLLGKLRKLTDPRERSKALRKLSDLEIRMAQVYWRAFGSDPIPGEGRDMRDSLVFVSMLYRSLSDVEHVVACNGRVGRNWRFHELGEEADRVLDRMAAIPNLDERLALLPELYRAVHGRVGGQAAEALMSLR